MLNDSQLQFLMNKGYIEYSEMLNQLKKINRTVSSDILDTLIEVDTRLGLLEYYDMTCHSTKKLVYLEPKRGERIKP